MIENIVHGLKPQVRKIPGNDAMNVHYTSLGPDDRMIEPSKPATAKFQKRPGMPRGRLVDP